jgi:hypothetical protein
MRAGVAMLPAGKRQARLRENLEKEVLPLFVGRVLPFDLACTQAYAELMAKARGSGLAIATADGYIAAIAAANGFTVATRDTGPFEASGVDVNRTRDTRIFSREFGRLRLYFSKSYQDVR